MATRDRRSLTTTSYVVLGLLSLHPWTAYELAKQVTRAAGRFWPRAERMIYVEPKVLVAHGLARVKSDRVGARPRSVYTITPKGRERLEEWLASPMEPPALEFEGMIRVFFAEQASKQVLLENIRSIRRQAESMLEGMTAVARSGNTEEGGQFFERAHVNALTYRFNWEYTLGILRWADWAEKRVKEWRSITADRKTSLQGVETFRTLAAQADEVLADFAKTPTR